MVVSLFLGKILFTITGKVQPGIFAEVSLCSFVIRFCSFLFTIEGTEVYPFSGDDELGLPGSASFVPGDAFVFGEALRSALPAVPAVLPASGRS